MSRTRVGLIAVALVVGAVLVGAVALPSLGGLGPFDGSGTGSADDGTVLEDGTQAQFQDDDPAGENDTDEATGTESAGNDGETDILALDAPVTMQPQDGTEAESDGSPSSSADATVQQTATGTQADEDAVEAGVDAGIELAQSQGVEVTQEQRAAAIDGARQAATQHQAADAEQVQAATAGAVHGSLMQEQAVNATQIQYAVGGATDGALAQHQTVNASQLQSATWGATHGALAQQQRVTVEQIQVATYGAAAGAASEAGDEGVDSKPKIQEAAQGAAYGVLDQYQKITAEQRQRITLEHVQHSAAGASAGALEGSTRSVLEAEQSQTIELEQRQRVDIKQVQKAATGAAKGALEQRQTVSVEQTQAAARGAGKGPLKQVQSVSVEQVQRISITQIQEAAFGASKGAIEQSQEASVEQIQAAADGASQGSLLQRQEVSITQIQHAATGASKGAVQSAVQNQIVEVEQIQAAARGAGEGAVTQQQVVDVTQVQRLAQGGSSGALSQSQEASIEQIQTAARSACEETARVVQSQRISITQLQTLTQETAADATQYAVSEGVTDVTQIVQHVEIEVVQRIEQVDELEGTAAIEFSDQESDGASVVVDEVDLSEGGFVAIYEGIAVDTDPDAVIGASDYLEAGEHEDLEIDLEEPIDESQALVAVVHHDTNDDGSFDYVESDGTEDEPYVTAGGGPVLDGAFVTVADDTDREATLNVSDQTGDGETLQVDEANASVDYAVTAEYNGERVDSESFTAGQSVEELELELEPPLEENATVDVSVRALEDDAELANDSIEYTVATEPPAPEPEATLNVSDQEGDGESLLVDDANASVEYVLSAEYDGERVDSESFGAGEAVTNESIALEAPIENDTTVDVAVRDAATDEELANDSIEYAVTDEPPEPGPEATLNVSDQRGSGETLVVDEANASVDYALAVAAEDGEQLAESETFTAGEPVANESLDLESPLEANATLEVAVVAADGDNATANETAADPLASETIQYTVDETAEELSVEYVDCTRVEVSGTLEAGDSLYPRTFSYLTSGPADTVFAGVTAGEEIDAPFTGTVVMEVGDVEAETVEQVDEETVVVTVPDEGDFGSYVRPLFDAADEPQTTLASPPEEFDCGDEIQPEEPTLSVENVTPVDGEGGTETAGDDGTDPGTFAVTFGYENPNEAPLTGGAFVNGTTADEPPEVLEPGADEFTVEWTPESDDEQLAWEVPMDTQYGYDEPVRAETEPAGEYETAPEFGVEFMDCSRAEVTGSFEEGDTIIVATGFYESGGFGNSMGEYALSVGENIEGPVEGTVVFETGEDFDVSETEDGAYVEVPQGDFGSAITGIASPDALAGSIDYPHPNGSECLEQVRPEQPEIGVEETTPTDDGDAIEVTFGYENPNDAPMAAISEFVEGTTADEPVGALEPGEHTFTVEWTPESDDERLVWEVDMSNFDYDEVLTAETETAGEIAPSEPAAYEVSIAETNAPVEQGEPLAIDADIENVGGEAAEQPVTLAVDGTETDSVSVGLEPGGSETVTLNAETSELEPGEYPVTVSSENETAETSVTIEPAGDPAAFAVDDVSTDAVDPTPGDPVTVSATITNDGDLEGTQTVTYSVDGQSAGETAVTLAGGESTTVSFETTVPEGESTHTIATEDDTGSVTVEAVAESGAGDAGDAGAGAGAGADDSPDATPEDGSDTQSPQEQPETPDETPDTGAADEPADSGPESADEPTGPGPSPESNGTADTAE